MLCFYCNVIGKSEFRVTKLILTFFLEMFGGFEVELPSSNLGLTRNN